jgi:tetratricopeptide (TPR) repeat protein
MLAVSAAAARVSPRVPSLARRLGRDGSRALGARRTIARGARDNPNFDPNDPMTWGTQQGDDSAFMEMGVPEEDLMQLSDEQLGQLLGAEGATVPVMLDDAELTAAFARAATADESATAGAFDARELPPESAAEAINKGLALYKDGQYQEALSMFTGALDLPGTGPIRSRKALVAPAGPSRGYADASVSLNEQIAIHYNCACCYSRLDDTQSGLVSLVRAMEAGYDDFANIRTDPDIAPLRGDARFEGIVARFEPQGVLEGVFAMLSKGTTGEQRKAGGAPRGGGGGELIGGLFNAVKDKMKK